MKVVFFGTPRFSANVLTYLLDHHVDIVAIVTKPDRPQGRSNALIQTPVKQVGLSRLPSIPIFQPEKISAPEHAQLLLPFQADLFVVVAFGEIIKQNLLDMPNLGCINLHTSLLPKYRGAAPIQRCLIAGETETGATIMHLVKKMDAGDVIKTVKISIDPDTTYGELEQHLCEVGQEALLETIEDFKHGKIERIPQDETLVTFAPKIELEECEIHWNRSAQTIHNLVRGVNPHPGAWCQVNIKGERKRLKINRTAVVSGKLGKVGQIVGWDKQGLVIQCETDCLRLIELQLEGKKAMKDIDFMRGISKEHVELII